MQQKIICRTLKIWGVSLIVAALASILQAQTTNATLLGSVHDATGAVIAGVNVSATNENTGETKTQLTNELGLYRFTTLLPGTWKIHAEAPGFRSADVTSIVLQVNQTARFDLTLEVGQVTEKLEVAAAAPPSGSARAWQFNSSEAYA